MKAISTVEVKQHLERLLVFFEENLNFANCHMVDFFTNSLYARFVPESLNQEIKSVGEQNVVNLMFQNAHNDLPNVQRFVENCDNLTLSKNEHLYLNIDELFKRFRHWGCDDNVDSMKIKVFMSQKKAHEVEEMSGVVSTMSKLVKASCTVDIGDGKGYLSSMVAFQNKMCVLGIDSSSVNSCGAAKRADKLTKIWRNLENSPKKSCPKKIDDFAIKNDFYRQATFLVDENFELEKLVLSKFENQFDKTNNTPLRLSLIGLHTCGDLSATILKMFSKNDNVKSICNVGCCYHLLTERDGDNDVGVGFPMSNFLRKECFILGRSARMIANQSVERIWNLKQLPNITIFYRALFQILLEKHCSVLPTKHVGKFRKQPSSLEDYVRTALKRVDVKVEISSKDIESLFTCYEDKLNELNIFYLLRCRISPVIETLILLDRLLFLREQGLENSFLIQLFDPVISPRCYGVVALKP